MSPNPGRLFLHLLSHRVAVVAIAVPWILLDHLSAQSGHTVWITMLIIVASIATGLSLSHLVHEWGHFIGALISRSSYRLKKKYRPCFLILTTAKIRHANICG